MEPQDRRPQALRDTVEYLASPELEGRAPGTPGGLLARRFVEERFEAIGLQPAGDDGYQQAIPAVNGANVLGIIPGTGPTADRYIVIAAHYDHLGVHWDEIYPGADDNASGVAVLLEVAGQLVARDDLDRSVLICSFDAEEPPHFLTENMGSIHFMTNPTVPIDRIDLMICLDIVGHALGDESLPREGRESIFVLGAERADGVGELVDRLAGSAEGIRPWRLDSDIIPPLSDHYAFEQAGIPFLFFTAGRTRHYHTPADTAEKLDYKEMLALADYLAALVAELSTRPISYEAGRRDDAATLTTLIELGTMVGSATSHPEQVMALLGKLEEQRDSGEPLSPGDRSALSMLLVQLENALA